MKTENVVLMRMARESLAGKWGLAIGAYVVYLVIAGALQAIPKVGPVSTLILGGPWALGLSIFYLSIARNQEANLEQIFQGFKSFGKALGTFLLMMAFILLWALLLIIPGIIAAFSYSMTFFIIADDPTISPMQAIDKSKEMMEGYKWKYFRLMLRILGLALLCILTLGIGFFWLLPFSQVCIAKFYEDLKADSVAPENLSTGSEQNETEEEGTN